MRKPAFYICENKDADQLRGNHAADQRLFFRSIDSTIPLLPKSEISSIWPSSVVVQPGLCQTWLGNPEDKFSLDEAHKDHYSASRSNELSLKFSYTFSFSFGP